MRRKMKLAFIENNTSRKTTFNKRKKGMMKKLDELVTLCDVKACAVVNSPYTSTLEAWPSREGVEEVVAKFMDLSVLDRTKKMVDHEAYLRQMITKEEEQLRKLRDENRNYEIRELMFRCLRGDMNVYHSDERDLRDLSSFIDKYLSVLTRRIEILTEKGESSSSVQNRALLDFYDEIPKKLHGFNMNLNSNQNMILDLNQNLNVREDEDIPSMDTSHHQPKTITTDVVDVCSPNITNNL